MRIVDRPAHHGIGFVTGLQDRDCVSRRQGASRHPVAQCLQSGETLPVALEDQLFAGDVALALCSCRLTGGRALRADRCTTDTVYAGNGVDDCAKEWRQQHYAHPAGGRAHVFLRHDGMSDADGRHRHRNDQDKLRPVTRYGLQHRQDY